MSYKGRGNLQYLQVVRTYVTYIIHCIGHPSHMLEIDTKTASTSNQSYVTKKKITVYKIRTYIVSLSWQTILKILVEEHSYRENFISYT